MSSIFDERFMDLKNQGLEIIESDTNRPWGGYFVIKENHFQNFLNIYFNGLKIDEIKTSKKLSFKILIVAPNKRLSWQYHKRRSEICKVISGKVEVITSNDNLERKKILLKQGDLIKLSQDERHRIIGTNEYATLAEIWIHTDEKNLSDEFDIVRVQDDYGR